MAYTHFRRWRDRDCGYHELMRVHGVLGRIVERRKERVTQATVEKRWSEAALRARYRLLQEAQAALRDVDDRMMAREDRELHRVDCAEEWRRSDCRRRFDELRAEMEAHRPELGLYRKLN